ncbi:DUF3331 domain-containing protein [Paraburkholderia sp. IMGN_8]|uniref:DUF3331 domain-containing protein n=1 Tax=Paraburkholderia sp. IMGN_8 TaxID=3136564 RepID=UPI003101B24F
MKPHPEAFQKEALTGPDACGAPHETAGPMMTGARAPVWDHVIGALLAGDGNEGAGEAYRAQPARRMAVYAPSPHIQVEVIERLSDTSIAVLWQDATRCRYAEQVWISCRARVKGRCSLSGVTIRRDDAIYKPRVRSTIPANADAMILASVIAGMID